MKLTGLVSEGAKDLGPRFLLLNTVPSALAIVGLLAIYFSGVREGAPSWVKLRAALTTIDSVDGFVLALAVVLAGLALQPLQLSLVRLLEGYWGTSRILNWLADLLRASERARRERLRRRSVLQAPVGTGGEARPPTRREIERIAAAARALRLGFAAHDAALLPTALGNALRAAEQRAGERYGFETLPAWPRLYPLLGERLAAAVDDLRNQLDFGVRLSVLLAGVGVASAALLWGHWAWQALTLLFLVFSHLAYRGAVASAIRYGQVLEVAFDLHRFDLLKAVCPAVPEDPQQQRELAAALSEFWREGESG